VIVGPHGWGKYQLDNEVRPAVLRRSADSSFHVIPVLLPGVNIESLVDFGEFFSRSHWVAFQNAPDEATAIRTLAYAVRGENAFPEGPPRLTASRVRFDAIRWDAGSRRDESLLYTGAVLRDAAHLVGDSPSSPVAEFLAASRVYHNQRLARQLSMHATVMWSNPRRRDLAARLACESVRRYPTAEGLGVLRQAYADLHRIVGTLTHSSPITAAACDSTRKQLATGCSDGSVRVWDGKRLRLLGKHAQIVRAVVDLGTGRFATGAADGTVFVWDWTSGQRVWELQAGSTVETLDARRTKEDTVLLASGGYPGKPRDVVVWNGDEGTERWRMGPVMHAAIDATGARVALASGEDVVLHRVSNGELAVKQSLGATVIGLATHPNQPLVAATTVDRRAHLISFASDPPERSDLGAGISRVSPVRISPNGQYAAAVRDDYRIVLWDLTDGTRQVLKSQGTMSIDIQFSDLTQYLAVVSPEATAVTVWRTDIGRHVCTIEQDAPSIALFDDRHNGLWTASQEAKVSFVEMPRQNEALNTAAPGITFDLAYGPNGLLAWCGYPVSDDLQFSGDDVELWVTDPIAGTAPVHSQLSELSRIAFDADGSHVAAIGKKEVRVWDLRTGNEAPAPELPFWGSDDQADGASARLPLLDTPAAADVCAKRGFVRTEGSSDGRFVAIDHGKQLVSIWDAATEAEVVMFSTAAAVSLMVFSANGALFATGDARGGIMVWQTDGNFLQQMQHDEPISHLIFSRDGSYLAAASGDQTVRVWIAAPALLAERVKAKVSGPLTDDEWARYLGDEPRDDHLR